LARGGVAGNVNFAQGMLLGKRGSGKSKKEFLAGGSFGERIWLGSFGKLFPGINKNRRKGNARERVDD